jgi:hypothetical protein
LVIQIALAQNKKWARTHRMKAPRSEQAKDYTERVQEKQAERERRENIVLQRLIYLAPFFFSLVGFAAERSSYEALTPPFVSSPVALPVGFIFRATQAPCTRSGEPFA